MKYHHGNLREALLDEAELVIEESGMAGLKPSNLAKRLGVSHSAPARHFKDRGAIIVALAQRALAGIKHEVSAMPAYTSSDPIQRLTNYLKGFVTYGARHLSHYAVLTYPDLPKFTGKEFTESHQAFVNEIIECIQEAQDKGLISGSNAEQLGVLCMAICNGLTQLYGYATHLNKAASDEYVALMHELIDLQIKFFTQG